MDRRGIRYSSPIEFFGRRKASPRELVLALIALVSLPFGVWGFLQSDGADRKIETGRLQSVSDHVVPVGGGEFVRTSASRALEDSSQRRPHADETAHLKARIVALENTLADERERAAMLDIVVHGETGLTLRESHLIDEVISRWIKTRYFSNGREVDYYGKPIETQTGAPVPMSLSSPEQMETKYEAMRNELRERLGDDRLAALIDFMASKRQEERSDKWFSKLREDQPNLRSLANIFVLRR